ncbi:Membrane protein insertase YidC [bioreactor metagenome]|uniref:Membrane protein insertase YidC n=1 Tax=bioreactor metagenome TaxID=1076179 RepID=A0A645AE60_9ZZZZ
MEIQKLYDREKVNPMGGCLWSLLPLPILIGLYGVIQKPLTYLMNLSNDEINELSSFLFDTVVGSNGSNQIHIAEELFNRFSEVISNLPALADKLFLLDYRFLGINLAQTPQWNITQFDSMSWNNIGLFLIPIVSAGLAFLSMQISMKTNSTASNSDSPAAANTKSMMYTMPLVSLWIGFTLPAALGIYWIANNVFTMLQEFVAGKLLKKDFEAMKREQAERELREKEEEKERRRIAAENKAKAAAEGKKRQAVERKVSGDVLANSRVGIRAYARGRNYDPNRFGGVTPYRDPGSPVNEDEVEAALEAKGTPAPEIDSVPAELETPALEAVEPSVPVAEAAPAPSEQKAAGSGEYEAEEAEPSEEDED